MEFSTRSIHRLVKDQGDKRVSEASADYLGEFLEEYATEVTEEAIELAKGDGRKTVKEEDIRDALS